MIRPLTRKIGGWWRICYHGHPTLPDHYTSAATANNAAAVRLANKRSSLA